MELEPFVHSLGIKRKNRYYEDCLQEARLALQSLPHDSTPAYKRQAVKWAIYNFLTKQLTEDYRVLKVRLHTPGMDMEDRIVERIAQRSEFKQLTIDMTPFERLVYVLTVSSPLDQCQIADTLEVSERTVRRTLMAAREKLKWRDKQLRDADAEIEPHTANNLAAGTTVDDTTRTQPASRKRKKDFSPRRGKQTISYGGALYVPSKKPENTEGS